MIWKGREGNGNGKEITDWASHVKSNHPTLEEVKAYCLERKNAVDAQRWLDYYTSNGWKVGRNSMKDWRAAVRTWEKNGFNSNTNGSVKSTRVVGAAAPVPGKYDHLD